MNVNKTGSLLALLQNDLSSAGAPVIEINRSVSAALEGRPAYPLRAELTFKVPGLTAEDPTTYLRFGYDTRPGGVIPTRFEAIVGGLNTLFKSVELRIDSGQFHPVDIPDLVFGTFDGPSYGGPLTVIGGVEKTAVNTATTKTPHNNLHLDLAYDPLPESIDPVITAVSANTTQIEYAHKPQLLTKEPPTKAEVDMTTTIKRQVGNNTVDPTKNEYLDVTARIDRMPSAATLVATSINEPGKRTQGTIDFLIPKTAVNPATDPPGRLPDASVDLVSKKPGENSGDPVQTLAAHADIETIPNKLHGEWYLPVTKDNGCASVPVANPCLARGLFEVQKIDASDPDAFVGALEATVANVAPAPAGGIDAALTKVKRFVPNEAQYVTMQSAPLSPGVLEELTTARVEKIRKLSYNETTDGFTAHAEVGDGELPLQVHVGTDNRTVLNDEGKPGNKLDATATLSPLPKVVDVTVHEADDKADPPKPLVVDWVTQTSKPAIDLAATAKIVKPENTAADPACGALHTTCANATITHIPKSGKITLLGSDDATTVNFDSSLGASAPKPDLVADFTIRDSVEEGAAPGQVRDAVHSRAPDGAHGHAAVRRSRRRGGAVPQAREARASALPAQFHGP